MTTPLLAAITELRNSSLYRELSGLYMADEYGLMVPATSLSSSLLSRNCSNPLVAEYARELARLAVISSSSQQGDPSQPFPLTRLLFSVVFLLVGCIGILGNLLTVWVIYSTASLHSATNLFLASLASSDLLLLLVGVPFDLVHLWKADGLLRLPAYCEIAMYGGFASNTVMKSHSNSAVVDEALFHGTSISLFTFASTLTIVSLTAERFVAICYPFSLRSLFHRRKVTRLIYIIWAVAFCPSIFIGMQFKRVTRDFCGVNRQLGGGQCDFVDAGLHYPFEIAAVITFALPLLFIVFCYVRILHSLNAMAAATAVMQPGAAERRVSRMNSNNSQDAPPPSPLLQMHTRDCAPPKSEQAQRMVIRMLVTVCAVFFLCYLPYHVERLIVIYANCTSTLCLMLYPITGLLQYVSATVNPLLYNLMSIRFRTAFRRLMREVVTRQKREFNSIVKI